MGTGELGGAGLSSPREMDAAAISTAKQKRYLLLKEGGMGSERISRLTRVCDLISCFIHATLLLHGFLAQGRLDHKLADHVPVHIREPEVAASIAERQALVVEA
jgi:hypothetical protein